MPIQIIGDLSSNYLDVPRDFLDRYHGFIFLQGSNSRLIIREPRRIDRIHLAVRDYSSVLIESGLSAIDLIAHCVGEDGLIWIGRDSTFNGKTRLTVQDAATLSIGNSCLFADDVEIMCGDAHGVYDLDTHDRINTPRDIHIEERVWIGAKVNVLKGARIGRGSVVGLGSVVTASSRCPPNSIIAGSPARVVRSRIEWKV